MFGMVSRARQNLQSSWCSHLVCARTNCMIVAMWPLYAYVYAGIWFLPMFVCAFRYMPRSVASALTMSKGLWGVWYSDWHAVWCALEGAGISVPDMTLDCWCQSWNIVLEHVFLSFCNSGMHVVQLVGTNLSCRISGFKRLHFDVTVGSLNPPTLGHFSIWQSFIVRGHPAEISYVSCAR